ncbi:MAG TPA: serine/threonine-protein kinase [Polyangiaceae bacterium]
MDETKLFGGGTELAGGWLVEEAIGLGGSAAVYRARRQDGTPGAVKVMHAHLALSERWLRRFAREVALLRKNPHPGVATVIDVGEMGGTPFYVMELLEGASLEALRASRGGSLPLAEVLAHADSVLEVLDFVHAAGVVHRDVKPSNLFLTKAGVIKVLDFGIASGEISGIQHTTVGGILGTPAFMSPEQARGRLDLVDHRSDLWSLAASLFLLISGQPVHVAETENERLGLAMVKPAPRLQHVAPEVPAAVAKVIDRALAYKPDERFPSALEFREALRKAAQAPAELELGGDRTYSDSIESVTRSVQRAKRSTVSVGGGVAAAALAALATWFALSDRSSHDERESDAPTLPSAPDSRSGTPVTAAVATVTAVHTLVPSTVAPSKSSEPRRAARRAPAPPSTASLLDQRVISTEPEILDPLDRRE